MTGDEHAVDSFLRSLHEDGVRHDEQTEDLTKKLRNVTPSTGRFQELLVEEERPASILELGTSNGYSTIWLARAAAAVGATLDSVDRNSDRHREAARNLSIAGFSQFVRLHNQEIDEFLQQHVEARFDMIFLDTDRSRYHEWWPTIRSIWNGKVLVCDNAVSHSSEFQPLLEVLDRDAWLDHGVLTVGRGLLLVRQRDQAKTDGAFVSLQIPGNGL